MKPLTRRARKALIQDNEKYLDEMGYNLEDMVSSQNQDASAPNNGEDPHQEANFQSCMIELEELEQQALQAAGMNVAPEEEDMFCALAL